MASGTPIRPRTLTTDFTDLPRRWWGDDSLATQVANGLTLVFPAGERFFIRSVLRCRARIADADLRAAVGGFVGQEGTHAHAHERVFAVMADQGYHLQRFLDGYERIAYGTLERWLPPSLCLATTAALEHFTAVYAERVLRDRLLDTAHPAMQALLYWHAAEEIEHKTVAFDVLTHLHPGHALRLAGLTLAVTGLATLWLTATVTLLRQERRWGPWRRTPLGSRIRRLALQDFVSGTAAYLRRDFHPSQRDTAALASAYLQQAGLTP